MTSDDDPERVVAAYLAAMEVRDLDAARDRLAPGAVLQFPGSAPMGDLGEVLAWAGPRYARVAKTCEGTDVCVGGVVYVRGTLSGEWPGGAPFAGIRFVDRFEVAQGRIVRQDVWNDIAEARP